MYSFAQPQYLPAMSSYLSGVKSYAVTSQLCILKFKIVLF